MSARFPITFLFAILFLLSPSNLLATEIYECFDDQDTEVEANSVGCQKCLTKEACLACCMDLLPQGTHGSKEYFSRLMCSADCSEAFPWPEEETEEEAVITTPQEQPPIQNLYECNDDNDTEVEASASGCMQCATVAACEQCCDDNNIGGFCYTSCNI